MCAQVGQVGRKEDVADKISPHSVGEVRRHVLHLEPAFPQVDVHPVLEGVRLDLDPLLLPAPDVHALGGMPLGRPGGQTCTVGLRHSPVPRHRHDHSLLVLLGDLNEVVERGWHVVGARCAAPPALTGSTLRLGGVGR